MKIWVVMGTTGEYSDRSEWPVKAFSEKQQAEDLIEKATQFANRIQATRHRRYQVKKGRNPFDPAMEMYRTGTRYFYHETELES